MGDDEITTIGRCYGCKRTFSFIPRNVTMARIDPETGLPPGMTVLGTSREPTPEAVARAVEEPICPDCVGKAEHYLESTRPSALRFEPWQHPDRG
jgi:hypothetical protein